jgi:adenylosuccinate synthase
MARLVPSLHSPDSVLRLWLAYGLCSYDIVARFNGGANAGHTVVVDGKKYAFHLLPCGLMYPHTKNLLGNGVVVDFDAIDEESKPLDADGIEWFSRLFISDRAHLLCNVSREPSHARPKSACNWQAWSTCRTSTKNEYCCPWFFVIKLFPVVRLLVVCSSTR